MGNWASQFRICHLTRDWKYSSAILGVSGLALVPIQTEMGWLGYIKYIANGSVRTVNIRHFTGHHGGLAIVTSHNRRYLVMLCVVYLLVHLLCCCALSVPKYSFPQCVVNGMFDWITLLTITCLDIILIHTCP